jgi:hypothetical protein
MVTSKNLTLRGDGGTLGFVPNDDGWTAVTLTREQVTERIGAESIAYLVERLCRFLEQPLTEWGWVLTLSETHTTLYGAILNDTIQLRFQDRNARFFADVAIAEERRREWIGDLRAWQVG